VTVKGSIHAVFSRGDALVDSGKWVGKTGRGRFLKRTQRAF
jgi:hypothetical protein